MASNLFQSLEADDRLDKPLTVEDIQGLEIHHLIQNEETQESATKRIFKDNAIAAAQSIVNIALFSQSQALRLKAASYVVERTIGRIQDAPPESADAPIEALVARFQALAEGDDGSCGLDADSPVSSYSENPRS